MESSSRTNWLPVERRNEIAVRALVYMKIRNGLDIDFSNHDKVYTKGITNLAKKTNCSEDELKKFTKEGMFTIFQHYCKVANLKEPQFNYQPDKDETWIKRRNKIGFAIFVYESTKSRISLSFRPTSETKKAELCMAYQCNQEELKLFSDEITHLMLTKALALF